MTSREDDEPYDQRYQATPLRGQQRRRRGLHVGRLRITATRVTVAIALVGSIAFLLYAITVRDPGQIPLLSTGSFVLALVFAGLAVAGAVSTYRAGKYGQGGRAFAMAVLGGIAGVIAFGCFAAAVILALVWVRTS
jgi:hypothetical protein